MGLKAFAVDQSNSLHTCCNISFLRGLVVMFCSQSQHYTICETWGWEVIFPDEIEGLMDHCKGCLSIITLFDLCKTCQ